MSAITRLLPQLAYLEIFGDLKRTNIDLKGWIANQDYLIDENLSSNGFTLRPRSKAYLKTALANDCNRMAIAAFETVCGIQSDPFLQKSGAWGVIRAYYSAFFAAHALLRMHGISCSQLDKEHVNKIFDVAQVLEKQGDVSSIEKGFYEIKINKDFTEVSFKKYKDSHKDTWACFLSLLNRLIIDVENTTGLAEQKMEARDILVNLRKGITRSRCTESGNWLSQIRNSVNYQHTFGVWYPYEGKAMFPKIAPKITEYWRSDPGLIEIDSKGRDIETFFSISLLVVSLFRESFLACSDKSDTKNSVFSNGALKLLNSIKAA
jgi:uncharacterized protein (UPF0332 family)